MNAQIGISDSAAIAQNGIFARDLAAATYGGSGFGGGAATGARAGLAAHRAGRRGGRRGRAAVVAGVAARRRGGGRDRVPRRHRVPALPGGHASA